MMRVALVGIVVLILSACQKPSTVNSVDYIKLYGSYNGDEFVKVEARGDYLYALGTFSDGSNLSHMVVYCLDTDGNVVWSSLVSSPYDGSVVATAMTVGDQIMVGGYQNVGDTNVQSIVAQMDLSGSVSWVNSYGEDVYEEYVNDISIRPSGEILLAGAYTGPDSEGQFDGVLTGQIRVIDNSGNVVRVSYIDGQNEIKKVVEVPSGELFMVGETSSTSNEGQSGQNILIYQYRVDGLEGDYYTYGSTGDQHYAGVDYKDGQFYVSYTSDVGGAILVLVQEDNLRDYSESSINTLSAFNSLSVGTMSIAMVGYEVSGPTQQGVYHNIQNSDNSETTYYTEASQFDELVDVIYLNNKYYAVGKSHSSGNTMGVIIRITEQ